MKKLTLSVLTALLSLTALSYADTPVSNISTSSTSENYGSEAVGFYGNVGLGSANSSILNSGVNNSTAARIDGGFKINPYMGFEVGVTGLTNPSAGNTLASMQFYDASFVGTLPLGHSFDFHGQVGLAYGDMSTLSNSNGTLSNQAGYTEIVTLVGAGLDIYLTRHFAITANDYMYIGSNNQSGNSSIGNTNVVMGGLKYNF